MACGVAKWTCGVAKRAWAWAKWSQICNHFDVEQNPDPHSSEKPDPDPYLIEKLYPDPDPRNPANVQVNSQYHGPCPAVDDFWPAGGGPVAV